MTNQSDLCPCGKCPACRSRRISEWSFRLLQEDKVSHSSLFITLTYDTLKVPISRAGFMALSKRDVQLFFKRLRFAHDQSASELPPIKYYLCGEYGGRTLRPHYHAIIFNADIELIQPAWNMGSIHYGKVSGASVGYTLKYMSKKSRIPLHQNDDRIPEFSLMSKGLGKNYLTPQMIEWHKADLLNRMYCNVEDKKISMPRYYKDKIYQEHERKRVAFFSRIKMLERKQEQMLDESFFAEKAFKDLEMFRRAELKEQSRNKI